MILLEEVWRFFKNLEYLSANYSLKEKKTIFLKLVFLIVCSSLALGFVIQLVSTLVGFNQDNHAVIEMFENYSPLLILVLAVVMAPVLEELVFRAPLALFKNTVYFKYAFHTSVILFGLVHISNFGNLKGFYWLIPILVAPQLFAGIFLGYIRTKLGLLWSILLHATMKMLHISFE